MMQNGLALQSGTSHDLGQNFGRAFDMKFQTKRGRLDYVWQTSWGVSTRLIGGLIMSHSDDKGLILPPKVAPLKSVLVPIYRKDERKAASNGNRIAQDRPPGYKNKDRRPRRSNARREIFPLGAPRRPAWFWSWARAISLQATSFSNVAILESRKWYRSPKSPRESPRCSSRSRAISYAAAKQRLTAKTCFANSIEEVESILADVTAEKGGGKFVMAHLNDDPICDARLKEFKATVRCIPSRTNSMVPANAS